MKKASTLFLRITLILLAVAVLTVCIFALPVGLRTDNNTANPINFAPIIIILYVSAIPFFIALWQSWKLLGSIDKNTAFSQPAVHALKRIKYCAIAIACMFVVGMPYLVVIADKDDAPGAVGIGLIAVFASCVIATFAGILQKLLRNVIDIKSDNEI